MVVGTVGTDRETSKPRNRLVVLHDGVVWAGYDKHFLPNYGVFDEFRIFSRRRPAPWCSTWTARASAWPSARTSGRTAARWPNSPSEHIDLLLTMNGSPYEEGKTHTRLDLAVSAVRPR